MKKILNKVFLLCICAALAIAAIYVAVEIVAVVTANGSLTIWAEKYLETPVCMMCSIAAIVTFVMSYVFRWTSGD